MQDLKVTIIQTGITWENIDENLEMFGEKLSLVEDKTDIIVLPEMFNTGFTMRSRRDAQLGRPSLAEKMGGKTMQWMKNAAGEKNCVIAGSLIIVENGHYYNRLIWMRKDGSYEYYDKRHLFRMMDEHKHFSSGDKKIVVELNGWRICPLVCYDLRFPVWSRNKEDYDCLIYIANWPEARRSAWSALLHARAIENQVYVIGVNRIGNDGNYIAFSGDSAVIDPKGLVISKTQPYQENIETVSLSYDDLDDFRKKFPVGLDGDEFEVR